MDDMEINDTQLTENLCDTSISSTSTEHAPIQTKQLRLDGYMVSSSCNKTNLLEKKSRAKRSIIWNFFKKSADQKFAICQIKNCNAQIVWSGNTSNCMSHLERRHPKHLHALENKTVVSSTSSDDVDNNLQKKKNISKQMSMRKYVKTQKDCYTASSAKKQELDKMLCQMVIRDLQPLSIVDDVGFNEFIHALDPRYVLPSRRRLRDTLIENAYEKTVQNLTVILNTVKYVGITFDGWTSCTTQHYLTITCHFLQNNELKTATLAVSPVDVRSTSENLSRIISGVFKKYQNLLVVAAVTDNARNVTAACNEMKITHIPCCAHTLQLVINHAIDNTNTSHSDGFGDNEDNIYTLIKKCKNIATFFHHSAVASKLLQKELVKRNLPVLKLVQSVETRWNSTYFMLERINKLFEAIIYVLLTVENKIQPFTCGERNIIPYVLKVLKPFIDATKQLSGEKYATMSLIIPCVKHILQELDGMHSTIIEFPTVLHLHRELKSLTTQYLLPYEERRSIAGLCTILDPRFKEHGFLSRTNYCQVAEKLQAELKDGIRARRGYEAQRTTVTKTKTQKEDCSNNMFSFLNELPVARDTNMNSFSQSLVHLNNYLEQTILPIGTNVIEFWQNYKGCEELKAIALKYLVIPATSVPSERVNSTAGNVITDKRSRLAPVIAEKLIMLRQNFENLKL